jgi:tRNA U38,U39,U40 pseudouridine synthase TruA
MLRVARGNMEVATFRQLLQAQTTAAADFSAPGKGLTLMQVAYPQGLLH